MRSSALWLVLVMAPIVGCKSPQFRGQSEDEVRKSSEELNVNTVGDSTSVWGAESVDLYGVGIVKGVKEGGFSEPGEIRRMAIHDLRRRGIEDPNAFLAEPDTALVIVRAMLPPGARKDDKVDVRIELQPNDPTASLRGGYLLECQLREYVDSTQLGTRDRGSLRGKVWVRARGHLQVGLGENGPASSQKAATIWSGGRIMENRNFALLLNSAEGSTARDAKRISERVNERFYGPSGGAVRGMAEAKVQNAVTLSVPPQYSLNLRRYLRVVRLVPMSRSAAVRAEFRSRLAHELADPGLTVVTALKLEALGRESISTLRTGLNNPHPLVRFSSAEALMYLGDTSGVDVLAKLIEEDPRFRALGRTAIASLNEPVCQAKLEELLASDSSQTAYGAFTALRELNETHPVVAGEHLYERFHLHAVENRAIPMIHILTRNRAEIVLFGREQRLKAPFSLNAGPNIMVTASEGDEQCLVSLVEPGRETIQKECPMDVAHVLKTLAAYGAEYPDVVDFLSGAAANSNLSCSVEINALPQATSVYELAVAGAKDRKELGFKDESDSWLSWLPGF